MIMTRYVFNFLSSPTLFCLYLHGFLVQYNVTYNSNRTATELRSIEIANIVNMVSAIAVLVGSHFAYSVINFANHCKLHYPKKQMFYSDNQLETISVIVIM